MLVSRLRYPLPVSPPRLVANMVERLSNGNGGNHELRIALLGRHPSDRPSDRDDRWGEHTFPSNWRSDLYGEPIASGSMARRTRACWRLAHPGSCGAALRGRVQSLQCHEMARAGLDPHRRDAGPGSLFPIRAVA